MKLYGTYNQRDIYDESFNGVKLNGLYDLSFFLNYTEYQLEGLTSIQDGDGLIPNAYTKLFVVEHTLTQQQIEDYLAAIPTEFNVTIITPAEAIAWVNSNTDLVETSPGTYITHEENTEFGIPEKTLVID